MSTDELCQAVELLDLLPEVLLEEENFPEFAVESQSFEDEQVACLRAVLNRLPADALALLWAHYGLGWSVRQLAARQRIEPGAMKMRLARLRCEIRAILQSVGAHSLADVERLGERGLRGVLLLPPLRRGGSCSRPRRSRKRRV